MMKKAILAAIIRHLVGAAGAVLAVKGYELDGASIEAISGGATAVLALVWSMQDKAKRA